MKNQTFRMTMLFDFYGELLTERQKEFYELYYDEDLSLSEIAENYGISRQGVRDVIVRAEAYMTERIRPALSSALCSAPPTSSASRRRRTSCAGSMTAGMRIPASQSS